MEIRTASGVKLAALPLSPSPDYMAGEDGRIYSRLRHKGFGRWELVAWHPVGGAPGKRHSLVMELDGRRVSLFLPEVVCAAFHGLPSDETSAVRHLDGDPSNNRADNLAWGTQQEVWADEQRRRDASGIRRGHRLSREDRTHLCWALVVGLCSQREAARKLGVALSTVQAILHEEQHASNSDDDEQSDP